MQAIKKAKSFKQEIANRIKSDLSLRLLEAFLPQRFLQAGVWYFLSSKSLDNFAQKRKSVNSPKEKKVIWWKPTSGDRALHKLADLEIVKQLAKRSYSIHVIVPTTNEKLTISKTSQVHIICIRMKYLPLILPLARSILLFFLFPIYIIAFQPDFIIGEPDVSILSFIPTIILSRLKKIKLILDIRSVPVETVGFLGSMMHLWFTVSIMLARKYFDGITIITSLMRTEICSRFQINPKKVGVWTSGVSTRLFNPSKYISARSEFKRKLGLTGKFVVLYHGIFSATRGLTQTIEAIRILKRTYPNTALLLLGRGPTIPKLRCLIRKENLQNNVIIHNPVDQAEVPKFISMCDVGIVPLPNNPYWRHQSPLKLLEYLAMEKVVIVTDIPAHRVIIGENKCGIYVSSAQPLEIAKAIEYAYGNAGDLKKWGKTGRKIIEERYTWEKVALDLEDYMLSIG